MLDGDVEAANAAALSNKLLQMANGAVYDENGIPRHIHDRKLEALEDLIEDRVVRKIRLLRGRPAAEMLDIKVEILEECWTVDLTVPFEFIKKHIPDYEFKKGLKHPANVYKCGDETEFPHWGCWKMVSREKPDFHIPSYFGTMTIV